MVTALGIGVASSTQSNINLRNTVYSTQSEQALACAEAGAEEAFGALSATDPDGNGGVELPPGSDVGALDTVCKYSYEIRNYPESEPGEVKIPALNENAVQELTYGDSGGSLQFSVTPLTSNSSPSLAVYMYSDTGLVSRNFYAFDNSNVPTNFEFKDRTGFTVDVPGGTKFIRLRPLYSSLSITIADYPTITGYKINAIGTAGIVNRKVEAYRFFSQLPSAFDEAVVMLGE